LLTKNRPARIVSRNKRRDINTSPPAVSTRQQGLIN
jgi:hypothetical protein